MNSIKKTNILFLLFAAFFASCAEEEAEVHPCDQDGHIVDTWNVTNYLYVLTDGVGTELDRCTGNSGTIEFKSDGTGYLNVLMNSGSTSAGSFTYSTASNNGARTLSLVFPSALNETNQYTFNECSQDKVDMTATYTFLDGLTSTETFTFTRQ